MLNDWGIHHFHLGTSLGRDGFVNRTGPLLYGVVLPDRVLGLQIFDHANWTNRLLIEILHCNWPKSLERCRIKGMTGVLPQPTDDELKQLRRGHVYTLLQMDDGTIYAPPGGGVATSGLSAQVVMDCDWYAKQMKRLEKHIQDNLVKIIETAKSEGANLPDECTFRLHVHNGSFVAVEESTNWGLVIFTPQ